MAREIPGPYDPAEMRRFLDTFNYREEAFLVDEVVKIDPEARAIEARMATTRDLPFTRLQRVDPGHPAHVNAGELLQLTGSLGCLHAWFIHGCRWEDGWAAFGNRIHRADFKNLARLGPPLRLESQESRTRVGSKRIVVRFAFHFWQEEKLVYVGDQTAMFVRYPELGSSLSNA